MMQEMAGVLAVCQLCSDKTVRILGLLRSVFRIWRRWLNPRRRNP